MRGKILKLIIITIILIIVILFLLLIIKKIMPVNYDGESTWVDTSVNNDGIYPEAEDLKYNELEELSDADDFATIYEYIKKFIYEVKNDRNKASNLIDSQYKQNNRITFENYNNIENFIVNKVYYENETLTITRYYVLGAAKRFIENNYFYTYMAFIIRCDYDNMTISLIPIENVNENDINSIRSSSNYIDKNIEENENNRLSFDRMKEKKLIQFYMDRYIYLCIDNPEKIYNEILDKDYKEKRFGVFDEFKNYIEMNKEKINNFTIVEYKIEENENEKVYIIEDNYKQNYIIKETKFMNYTMMLDQYTIIQDSLKQRYSVLDKKSKVHTNIDMFIKMINTKDYIHAYEKLDEDFRTNYFGSVENFKEYINKNFFENNYLNIENIEKIDDIYIVKTNIQNNVSKAADTKQKQFIVKLEEGTDFTMSFNMD